MTLRLLMVAGLLACIGPARVQADSPPRLVSQYDLGGCGGFALDANGVVQVTYPPSAGVPGLQYNPVTIAQTALGCYHQYKQSGSPDAHRLFLDQIRWLTEHFVAVGDDMAAYEYHFAWSYGLKPGWRSGLAQGQAISALIRYHYDTGNTSVLPLIRKLKNFMFLPREQGGVLATSPEGGIWFEEFPSDPPSLVWNGHVSAVFGLYEFTRLFPDDATAQSQYEAAIASLKASLPAYDIGDWTVKDRYARPYPKADTGYAIGHAIQMKTMAEITGDPFFRRVWLRWQSFFSDANFDAAGTMTARDDILRLVQRRPAPLPPDRLASNVEVTDATPAIEGYGIAMLFDRDDTTYFAPAEEGETHLQLRLKRPMRANVLSLGLYNPILFPRALHLKIRACDAPGLTTVPYVLGTSRLVLSYHFPAQDVCEIRISSADNAGQNRMVLSELSLDDVGSPRDELPAIGSHVTPIYRMTAPGFTVRMIAAQAPDAATAMYRCADSAEDVEKHGWVFDMLDPVRGDSRPATAPFCQFKFLSDPVAASAGWRVEVMGGEVASP